MNALLEADRVLKQLYIDMLKTAIDSNTVDKNTEDEEVESELND